MTFMELLLSAKLGSTSAFEELFARYKNLLRKYSVVNGIFDEDLYQEQCVLFAHCEKFNSQMQQLFAYIFVHFIAPQQSRQHSLFCWQPVITPILLHRL